jgi:hypothetical protein
VRLLALCIVVALVAPAHAADFRWTSAFGQGTAVGQIQNQAGSLVHFACNSGGLPPGGPSLHVQIKGKDVPGSRLYQFVIDGKNRPVTLQDGWLLNAQARHEKEALMSIAYDLVQSRATTFTVELPELRLEERFSLLNVKDALGAAPGKTLADCEGPQ